eukprot:TRINITY_DN1907_c0_g1_i1.p3 TRINITY_DN1907_c0_g1~~TRINITY_DN1907_c0_g1_i1.p3  ORF type:complete len:237 (+),score=36.92 TRINITY_DN1907_c0_g1_i1:360-1070(+)
MLQDQATQTDSASVPEKAESEKSVKSQEKAVLEPEGACTSQLENKKPQEQPPLSQQWQPQSQRQSHTKNRRKASLPQADKDHIEEMLKGLFVAQQASNASPHEGSTKPFTNSSPRKSPPSTNNRKSSNKSTRRYHNRSQDRSANPNTKDTNTNPSANTKTGAKRPPSSVSSAANSDCGSSHSIPSKEARVLKPTESGGSVSSESSGKAGGKVSPKGVSASGLSKVNNIMAALCGDE